MGLNASRNANMHGLMTYPERVDPSAPLNHRYEGIIDVMLANPHKTRTELAEMLGFTLPWFSNVVNNNAFQARYGFRRNQFNGELNDRLTTKLHEMSDKAVDRVLDALDDEDEPVSPEYALDAATKGLRALGFGAPKSATPTVVNNTQVNVEAENASLAPVLAAARERMEAVSKLMAERPAIEPAT